MKNPKTRRGSIIIYNAAILLNITGFAFWITKVELDFLRCLIKFADKLYYFPVN